jgi:hypothetical protein
MNRSRWLCEALAVVLVTAVVHFWVASPVLAQSPDVIHAPCQLNTGLVSRSISFENPTVAPGEARTANLWKEPGPKKT